MFSLFITMYMTTTARGSDLLATSSASGYSMGSSMVYGGYVAGDVDLTVLGSIAGAISFGFGIYMGQATGFATGSDGYDLTASFRSIEGVTVGTRDSKRHKNSIALVSRARTNALD